MTEFPIPIPAEELRQQEFGNIALMYWPLLHSRTTWLNSLSFDNLLLIYDAASEAEHEAKTPIEHIVIQKASCAIDWWRIWGNCPDGDPIEATADAKVRQLLPEEVAAEKSFEEQVLKCVAIMRQHHGDDTPYEVAEQIFNGFTLEQWQAAAFDHDTWVTIERWTDTDTVAARIAQQKIQELS